MRGAAELARRGEDISLLIVGDGVVLEELKLLAAELHISDRTVFTGSVPHHRVRHYYDMIDIFVISRPALRVTEIVTPLKPLEAMAMGKPIVVSDLPALREIVADGQTGLVYRSGNAVDLADQCRRLLRNPQLYRDIAEAGRNWVRQERTWAASLRPLGLLYEMLGSAPETAA